MLEEKLSQSDQTRTGAERRRYPRVPLSMKAIFRGNELEGKPCIIRDFCPGGFFLSWPDDAIGTEILAFKDSLPDQKFSVEFGVKHKKSGSKTYSISFKVVRVFQGGMGVSFENPDQNVIDILVKIAEATLKKKQARSEQKKNETHPDEQTSFFNKSLQGQIQIESNLSEFLRSYFKKLENQLIVFFKETADETEKFEYFNAHEIIKNDPEAPRTAILKAISAQLEERPSLKWEKTFDDDVDGNSLTLVDEKEFEAYLALTGIISDAEADNRLLLFRVARKLTELFETDWDEGMNPLGFSRLFRTIDSYLKHLKVGYTTLKVAYQLMEDKLVPDLILLYEELSTGIEEIPAGNTKNSFRDENESSVPADLDSKVEPRMADQQVGVSGNNISPEQSVIHQGQNFQQQGNFQSEYISDHSSGHNNGFPTLEGNTSSSSVTRGAGGLAQTLMALKNSVGAPETIHKMFQDRAVTTPTAGVSGSGVSGGQQQNILQFLDKIQQEDNLKWQNGETISDVTGRLMPMLYGAQQQVDQEAESALNLAGGVLGFLKEDQYLSDPVRQDLKRMQTVLYKQAVSEGGLFQDRSNPLRNIVNLLEQVDKKGGNSQPQTRKVLDQIIGKILSLKNYDSGNLDQISDELNDLLDQQINQYEQRVEEVVEQCDLEQTMLKDLRKTDDQELAKKRTQQVAPNGEYKVWQDRARAMARGDSVVVEEGNGEKKHLSLAWSAPDSSRFVFVDGEGNKAANMTQQELIVRLLKGTTELTDKDQKPLFDRAIVSSLFNAYDEVKQQIINDPETGLINEEKYRTELKLVLENAIQDHVEHAFFYLSVLPENNDDNEKVIIYLKHISKLATDVFGEQSHIGRLGEKSLGITSEFMSREGSLILAETLLKSIEDNVCELNNSPIFYPVTVGISVINDRLDNVDEVISQAVKASEKAEALGDNQAWLHEEIIDIEDQESEQESVDWLFWLEDHCQDEDVIPLFGHKIIFHKDAKEKPLFHVFPAFEDDEGQLSTPARFIKAFNENDLITLFEKQFLKNCLGWMSENKKQLKSSSRYLITLSGKTINSKGMLDFVIELLSEKAVPPGKICFEVPGKMIEKEKVNITRFIRTLTEFGCRFSVGQFGNDGLNQETLKLPVDYICIDENLTSDVVESAQSYGLIKSINDIAHMMDKKTIIPQRVSDDALELLKEMNIDYISSNETEKPVCLNPVIAEG